MSGARQDWARLGAAATQDPRLSSFAGGGAVLLWDRDAGRPGHVDAAGRALLGGDATGAGLPAATRQRLTLLASGLAPRGGLRLERLRLTQGFAATRATCGCMMLEDGEDEAVLAIVVAASELRRLGVVVSPAPATAPVGEPGAEPPAEAAVDPGAHEDEPAQETAPVHDTAPVQETAPTPRRALVRFLWQSDAEGRIVSASPDLAEVIGRDAAAVLPGRLWSELIGHDVIDRQGDLAERLAAAATWSGHAVIWRIAEPTEGVLVELSGVPVLDTARNLAGFRGFGLARTNVPEPFLARRAAAAAPLEEAIAEVPVEEETAEALLEEIAAETPVQAAAAPVEQAATEAPSEKETAEPLMPAAASVADLVEPVPDRSEPDAEAEAEAALPVFVPAGPAATPAPPPEPKPEATPALPANEAITAALVELAFPEPNDQSAIDEDAAYAEPAAADEPDSPAAEPEPARDDAASGANVVPLRNGHLTSVRPVLEPSKPDLSLAERNAFREIAKALGARIAGDEEIGPRLPPALPYRFNTSATETPAPARETEPVPEEAAPPALPALPEMSKAPAADAPLDDPGTLIEEPAPAEAPRARAPNSHADVLDRLPVAVLVNRGEEALYANRALLDLLDYADLADLATAGGVSRIIKGAARAAGGAMLLIDRRGRLVSVEAALSGVSWHGEPASLMSLRHQGADGLARVLSPDEAEEAEFAAEEAEIGARVEALRLDVDSREARIGELVAMLDTATDGVVTVDERGRMLSLNRTAEALFGYDQREVTGELFTLLLAAESHAPGLDYLEGLKGGGVASVMNDGREVIGRVRQGGKIPLFMTMGQIADGPERRFCAVLRDITAWKKTEGELVEARKAAEKASAQKSDVLAKISHEIRTPLNAIIGFAEVMAEERFGPIANERYKEYLRDIHQSGGYVISLVNDLLDLAKIEAGKLDLDFVSVNLNEIALSTVNLLQTEAQRGRVVLRSGLALRLPPVVADQRSIRQIVINLLSNAVKFTDAGGQVIVSTALGDQGEAILRVRDTGIGMDDHEIALALEPFRQVPATRRAGGTGLGLPLTKALVEANRAAMTITSVKKEGTLVEITFPPQRVLAG